MDMNINTRQFGELEVQERDFFHIFAWHSGV